MKITAPWSRETVDRLNRYQSNRYMHPYTCGNDHGEFRNLVATPEGWVCPTCEYTQDWAHQESADFCDYNPFEDLGIDI